MIHTVMEALKDLSPLRPEGADAGRMPLLTVTQTGDQCLYRADGRDYARVLRCQVDAFGTARAQAEHLFEQAQRILTRPPYGYCLEMRMDSFDDQTQTFRVSARYRATAKIEEAFDGSFDERHGIDRAEG